MDPRTEMSEQDSRLARRPVATNSPFDPSLPSVEARLPSLAGVLPSAGREPPMTLGKRLLVHSAHDPSAAVLTKASADWGCMVSLCGSIDELRGRIEGADHDYVLVESSEVLRRLIAHNNIEETLTLTLAEVEKRHIQRVLASTDGNKTRAARILGIDTKTLYNKLKSYRSSEELARKRMAANQGMPGHAGRNVSVS
ncbi:MAG: helix-turn-helix domain-containing protein [Planctomycetota bacterium]